MLSRRRVFPGSEVGPPVAVRAVTDRPTPPGRSGLTTDSDKMDAMMPP